MSRACAGRSDHKKMPAAPNTLHTRVRRSACVHGAYVLMPGHVQLARLGCRGPGTSQTDRAEKRVMPPLAETMAEIRTLRLRCMSNAPHSEVTHTQYETSELPGWISASETVIRTGRANGVSPSCSSRNLRSAGLKQSDREAVRPRAMQVRAERTMVHELGPQYTPRMRAKRHHGATHPQAREDSCVGSPSPAISSPSHRCRKASRQGSHSRRPCQQRPAGEERRRRGELAAPAGRSRAGCGVRQQTGLMRERRSGGVVHAVERPPTCCGGSKLNSSGRKVEGALERGSFMPTRSEETGRGRPLGGGGSVPPTIRGERPRLAYGGR